MSLAATLRDLIRDLEAEGIPYRLDDHAMRFPVPVRHQIALTMALGRCAIIDEEYVSSLTARENYDRRMRVRALRDRVHRTLRAVEAWGKTTRWAGWFERGW